MWSILWSWAISSAGTCLLSLLIASFADGVYEKAGYAKSRSRYSGYPVSPVPDPGWTVFLSLLLAAAFFWGTLWFAGYLDYNIDSLRYPLADILESGARGTLYTVGGTMLIGAATIVGIKIFAGATRFMKNLGMNFNTAIGKIGKWRDARRNAAALKLQQQQQSDQQARNAQLEDIRNKQANINRLCGILQQAKKEGRVFDALGAISSSIAKILAVINEDGNKQTVLPTLISDYLAPAEQCLQLYERLTKRDIGSAKESLQDLEEKVLPLMSSKFAALYDQVHVHDIAALATAASSFEVARTINVRLPVEAPAELKL